MLLKIIIPPALAKHPYRASPFSQVVDVRDYRLAYLRQLIVHFGRHHRMHRALNQTRLFEIAHRLGEHLVGNARDAALQLAGT